MFTKIRRSFSQFFRKSGTINNEPLNKVSLIVLILVDIFILINVFMGLADISRWHISPTQAYPCYSEWERYRTQTTQDKDYKIVSLAISYDPTRSSFRQIYQQEQEGYLGNVSETCLQYADSKDKIRNPKNQQTNKAIAQKQGNISTLEGNNNNIRAQYDSTLLEKIAGQPRDQSLNSVSAEKAKQALEQNNLKISTLAKEVSDLKDELVTKPESVSFIAFLKDSEKFREVEQGYQQAAFWYPSIQLAFQSLFLLPLILVASSVHKFAQRKGYGLISLISWHLLVIFLIPLVLKIFQFLQVGAIFQAIFNVISFFFGGLLFLINYVYILLIPLVGFGIIKFLQKIIFNPKLQAASRVQKSCCIRCAKKIQPHDAYCPHCGFDQYAECPNCHSLTYKNLSYCKQCGHPQDL